MTDRFLTIEQTAAYLGISPATVGNWRSKRQGPRYVMLGAAGESTARRIGKSAIRYRVSDLEAWIAGRIIDPATAPKPPHLRMPPRTLTDAEWTAVDHALHGPRASQPWRDQRRRLIDTLLLATHAGIWPPQPPGEKPWAMQIRKGTAPGGWIIQAFDALAGFTDFPFALAIQTVIIRRLSHRQFGGSKVYRLRTEAHGSLQGRKRRELGSDTLKAVDTLQRAPGKPPEAS